MLKTMRTPLQGVTNILRFNWHFYVLAVVGVLAGLAFANWMGGWWLVLGWCVAFMVVATTAVSLLVSWYVYDFSDLYDLAWLPENAGESLVNIHAGFDETSALLAARYPAAELTVLDFYDPKLHTEVSIQRARKAYPAYPGTRVITTRAAGLATNSVDTIFLIFAAHEIRDTRERTHFFSLLRQALKPDGRIYVTEHLRDPANFLAYSLGAYHFLPPGEWQRTFTDAQLQVTGTRKITPFVTAFTVSP